MLSKWADLVPRSEHTDMPSRVDVKYRSHAGCQLPAVATSLQALRIHHGKVLIVRLWGAKTDSNEREVRNRKKGRQLSYPSRLVAVLPWAPAWRSQ